MPIEVISKLKPKNNLTFPIVEDIDLQGSLHTIDTITNRNLIPSSKRKEGMIVYVQADGYYYNLVGGITNSDWDILNFGGGGGGAPSGAAGGDLTGTYPNPTLAKINNTGILYTNTNSFSTTEVKSLDGAALQSFGGKGPFALADEFPYLWIAAIGGIFRFEPNAIGGDNCLFTSIPALDGYANIWELVVTTTDFWATYDDHLMKIDRNTYAVTEVMVLDSPQSFGSARRIAYDSDNNKIWALKLSTEELNKINATTNAVDTTTTLTSLSPKSLAYLDGYVYVGTYNTDGYILQVKPSDLTYSTYQYSTGGNFTCLSNFAYMPGTPNNKLFVEVVSDAEAKVAEFNINSSKVLSFSTSYDLSPYTGPTKGNAMQRMSKVSSNSIYVGIYGADTTDGKYSKFAKINFGPFFTSVSAITIGKVGYPINKQCGRDIAVFTTKVFTASSNVTSKTYSDTLIQTGTFEGNAKFYNFDQKYIITEPSCTLDGDVVGNSKTNVVTKINGTTAPSAPGINDTGKVIGVDFSGYALISPNDFVIKRVSSSTVLESYDVAIMCTTGGFNITLPANPIDGKFILIKDTDGTASGINAITISTTDGTLIDGAVGYTMSTAYQCVKLIFNSINWNLI